MIRSPFVYMAYSLALKPVSVMQAPTPIPKGSTKTDSIRNLLRESPRPLSAAEIAFDLDLPSSCTVWLLMKYDMQKGRVLLDDGKYTWNHDYDTAEAEEIRAAAKLLKRHGYQVVNP